MNPARAIVRKLLPLSARDQLWKARTWLARQPSRIAAALVGVDLGGERLRFTGRGRAFECWLDAVRRGEYVESAVIEKFIAAVAPGETVIDLGAWVGPYALVAGRLVGATGRVYAFEPDPIARRALKRNARLNRITNVTIMPLAVSDSSDGLFLPQGEVGTPQAQVATLTGVPSTTLDEFCRRHHVAPDVVKVDIEGGETAALSAQTAGLALRHAHTVFVEVHMPTGVKRKLLDPVFAAAGKRPVPICDRPEGISNLVFVMGDSGLAGTR
jgi:FkbM family methyltransferase